MSEIVALSYYKSIKSISRVEIGFFDDIVVDRGESRLYDVSFVIIFPLRLESKT